MPIHNADIFEEIADLLEIQGANPFRIRAYRNAARTLGELSQDVRMLVAKGDDLKRLPGIGPKRVKALYHDFEVQTVEQLYRDGRIRALPGFGEKTELNILQVVEAHVSQVRRFKLAVSAACAKPWATSTSSPALCSSAACG